LIWGVSEFPPYINAHPDGQIYGPIPDIVKNTFKHAGIEYSSVYSPKRRANKALNEGLTDFSVGALFALDNLDNFYVSHVPLAKIELQSYWIGEQKPVFQAIDLKGQSVVLITTFEYSGLRNYIENPDNKVTLAVDVEDHRRALSALLLNRATYMLGYRTPTDLALSEMDIQNLNSQTITQTDIYLVLNKSVKNSRQIMDKLDASFSVLYQNNADRDRDADN
jgi:polar amino acid transport system substrate-binding protein